MNHEHLKTTIDRRLALSIGAGVLCAGFVPASTPVGPHEARLRSRLRAELAKGLARIRVTWLPSTHGLSRDERSAAVRATLTEPNDLQTPGAGLSTAV